MKRNFFQTLCAMTVLLGIGSTLLSCGDHAADPANTETAADTQTAVGTEAVTEDATVQNLAPLGELDFGGAQFRISTLDRNSFEIFSEAENGEVCNDAIFARNRLVEETLNVKITPILTTTESESDHHSQVNNITKSVQAGEDYCDIAALFVYRAGTPIINGIFRSWDEIPHVDFSQPWWITRANEAFRIAGKQYLAVGDLAVTNMLMTYGTFFNKRLVENYDIPDLYQTVLDGKWTIDLLDTYAKTGYADLNGNGAIDENDQFGYTGESIINCDVMLASFGQKVIEMDADGLPHVVINTPRTVSAVEKIYSLFWENEASWIVDTWMDELPIFASGRAMFITTYLDNAFNQFRDMEDAYGILPFPKFDEAQEDYLSDARDQYSVLCIPVTAQNSELIGAATEAMNIASNGIVYPAYYETALKSKYVSDSESVVMIDLLMQGRNYDFSILHGAELNALPYIVRNLITGKKKDFASTYAKMESGVEKKLQALTEAYQNLP